MATKSERDDRPRKKKKQSAGNTGLWIGLGIGGALLLLLLVGGGVTLAIMKPWARNAEKKEVLAQNPPPKQEAPVNPGPKGIQVRKNPKSLLGRVYYRGTRASLDNEMRQIKLFYEQYCLEYPNANKRTVDSFLNYIRRDSFQIHNAIKEDKFYTMNVKARLDTKSIIAYETEAYDEGYYCIQSDGSIGIVSEKDWKASLGIK
ncbi:MAG: hypothetical protein HYX68_21860 [Planctomycetes bacterium]|nr:hypothetical protein [Planctomycetota bacterium]